MKQIRMLAQYYVDLMMKLGLVRFSMLLALALVVLAIVVQMAVTMVRAMYGPDYAPPPAVGIFADVEISDTSTTADYIEQLYNDGVVNGCGTAPMRYCPNDLVNRAAMSKYLVNGFSIPLEPVTGYFTDVTGTIWDAFAPYAEALLREGITLGCGGTNFCPADTITRDQLAVFLVRALGLPMYTHPVAP